MKTLEVLADRKSFGEGDSFPSSILKGPFRFNSSYVFQPQLFSIAFESICE